VPARREEEHEVEGEAGGCREAGEEPEQHQDSDRDLHQRDGDAGELGVGQGGLQERAARRSVGKAVQLRPDVGRSLRVQEAGIAELLDPRVHEGPAEEQPERQQRCGRIRHHPHYEPRRR
jgi:hypothetical protein